jgi:hypothetical protein
MVNSSTGYPSAFQPKHLWLHFWHESLPAIKIAALRYKLLRKLHSRYDAIIIPVHQDVDICLLVTEAVETLRTPRQRCSLVTYVVLDPMKQTTT